MSQGGEGDATLAAMWNFRSRPCGSSGSYEVFTKTLKYRIEPAGAAAL